MRSFIFGLALFCVLISCADPNLSRTLAVKEKRGLTLHQMAVIVLVCAILFGSIFGVFFASIPMLMPKPQSGFSLAEYSSLLAQANQGVSSGLDLNSVFLEFQAATTMNPPTRTMQELNGLYPAKRFLKKDKDRMAWTSLDKKTGKQVVLKMFPIYAYKEQAENEIEVMQRLGKKPHPGLKGPLAVYVGLAPTAIISELIDGVPWGHLPDLTFDEHLFILIKTAEALFHLHEKIGMVHGDLHFENIIIDRTGRPCIIDFSHSTASRNRYDYQGDVQILVSNMIVALAKGNKIPATVDMIPSNLPNWFKELATQVLEGRLRYVSGLVNALKGREPVNCRRTLAAKVAKLADELTKQ